MKKRTTLTLTVLFALAAGAASLVRADAYERRSPRVERLQIQAHRLEEATWRLERDALRFAFRRGGFGPVALQRIDELARSARRFHRAVERRPLWNPHTDLRFRRLMADFRDVRRVMYRARVPGWIHRDFDRVELLVQRVRYSYKALQVRAGHRRGHGHGRFARDVDWDDDRDDDRRVGRRSRAGD